MATYNDIFIIIQKFVCTSLTRKKNHIPKCSAFLSQKTISKNLSNSIRPNIFINTVNKKIVPNWEKPNCCQSSTKKEPTKPCSLVMTILNHSFKEWAFTTSLKTVDDDCAQVPRSALKRPLCDPAVQKAPKESTAFFNATLLVLPLLVILPGWATFLYIIAEVGTAASLNVGDNFVDSQQPTKG